MEIISPPRRRRRNRRRLLSSERQRTWRHSLRCVLCASVWVPSRPPSVRYRYCHTGPFHHTRISQPVPSDRSGSTAPLGSLADSSLDIRSGTLRKQRAPSGRQLHALVDLPTTLELSAAKFLHGSLEMNAEGIC